MQSLWRNSSQLSLATQWFPAGLEHLPASCVALQAVRWKKSRLVPPNKNKLFKVPTHPMYAVGESDEIMRLTHKFSSHVKSTSRFLRELYEKQSDTSEAAMLEAEEEDRQHRLMMEFNDQENARIAKLRELRVQRELNDRLECIVINKLKHKEREVKQRSEALELLQETEELVKTFIPPEEFATMLEKIYDNPIDYNYAIDAQGYMYPGHGTKPWQVKEKQRVDDQSQPTTGAVCSMKSAVSGN